MFARLKSLIRKQDFNPGKFGLLVNPFYFARKALHQEIKSLACHISGRVLDVGCGSKPYESLLNCREYVGMEIDAPENREKKVADLFYKGEAFPVEDSSFDWVVSTQVFEHVFNPDAFLSEIDRVLKPGGGLLMTVPFVWDEHEQPFDFARYSSFGLKSLLERHSFAILEQRKTLTDIRVLFQLLNAYIYKVTVTRSPCINLLICVLLMSPFNVLGQALSWLLPENKDLYLDNIILARKVES
jgi:SAM-dependent methyltransferase